MGDMTALRTHLILMLLMLEDLYFYEPDAFPLHPNIKVLCIEKVLMAQYNNPVKYALVCLNIRTPP